MTDQVEEFRKTREDLDSVLKTIELNISTLQFQQADEQLQRALELYEHLRKVAKSSSGIQQRSLQIHAMRIRTLDTQIQNGLERKEEGKREDGNIAFKCNWNDKNYQGVCSDTAYDFNVSLGHSWCTRTRGKCRKYVNIDPVPQDCCYEARALMDFRFAAGWDHDEYGNFIRPRRIWSARKGKIALLTTEPPDIRKRLIVGAFMIYKVWDDPGVETWIYGKCDSALDDMLQYEIEFWKYHKNPGKPSSTAWATGLFRYVSDVAVLGILEEYLSRKRAAGGDTRKVEYLLGILRANRGC